MHENVIEIRGLSRQFGSTCALDQIDLTLMTGVVHGLVGANGAGKTTLIKHLLGLLKPQTGSVRVFGMDPVKDCERVLERIGYLSESRELPEWMRVDELMRYSAAFYPQWDHDYVGELIALFGLDGAKKIRALSKGMRAQVGLINAVASKPDLLLLDEPSTGLDAVVRRDILNAIVRTVADDGRTVVFSSHLLDEVEQMSDQVLMIDGGKWILQGDIDAIKQQHHHVVLQFDSPLGKPPIITGTLSTGALSTGALSTGTLSTGTLSVRHSGVASKTWQMVCESSRDRIHQDARECGGVVVSCRGASLEEIFVARVGRDRLASAEA